MDCLDAERVKSDRLLAELNLSVAVAASVPELSSESIESADASTDSSSDSRPQKSTSDFPPLVAEQMPPQAPVSSDPPVSVDPPVSSDPPCPFCIAAQERLSAANRQIEQLNASIAGLSRRLALASVPPVSHFLLLLPDRRPLMIISAWWFRL